VAAKRSPAKPGERPQRGKIGRARWAQVAALAIEGKPTSEIARLMKVSPGVISDTVLHVPEVVAMVEKGRQAHIDAAVRALNAAVGSAVSALVRIAEGDPDEDGVARAPHAARVAASKEILARAVPAAPARVELSGAGGGAVKVEAVSVALREAVNAAPLERLRALAGLPEPPEPLPEDDDGEG